MIIDIYKAYGIEIENKDKFGIWIGLTIRKKKDYPEMNFLN